MAHFRTHLFYQFSTKKIQPVIHRTRFGDQELIAQSDSKTPKLQDQPSSRLLKISVFRLSVSRHRMCRHFRWL